jgi:hypothetical protein
MSGSSSLTTELEKLYLSAASNDVPDDPRLASLLLEAQIGSQSSSRMKASSVGKRALLRLATLGSAIVQKLKIRPTFAWFCVKNGKGWKTLLVRCGNCLTFLGFQEYHLFPHKSNGNLYVCPSSTTCTYCTVNLHLFTAVGTNIFQNSVQFLCGGQKSTSGGPS